MKRYCLAIAIVVAGCVPPSSAALAVEQPRIVARSAHVDRPAGSVYSTLKHYFSDPSLSMFHLASADEKKMILVATRSGIDGESWNNWAFCEAAPVQMIYKFQDGAVKVTVQLEPSGKHASFISVIADFEGTYALGTAENKINCVSKGGLEQAILGAAGAPANPAAGH